MASPSGALSNMPPSTYSQRHNLRLFSDDEKSAHVKPPRGCALSRPGQLPVVTTRSSGQVASQVQSDSGLNANGKALEARIAWVACSPDTQLSPDSSRVSPRRSL